MPNEQANMFPDTELPAIRPGADGSITCHCHHCDEVVAARDTILFDDESHCGDCVVECEHCNAQFLVDDDEVVEINVGGLVTRLRCSDCRFACADCDEQFTIEGREHFNGREGRVCEQCARSYCTCESCIEIISQDDSSYDERSNRTLCNDCYSNWEEEDEESGEDSDYGIRDHSYKPYPCFKHEDNIDSHAPRSLDTLYYGVEVEVEGDKGAAERVNGSLFYCKEDCSLDDGFEIVSHPATLGYWRNEDTNLKVFDKLRRDGWRSYDADTCGMHVHVSRSALSELDILKLLRFFRDNPRFVFFISRRKRLERLERWAAIDEGNQASLLRKAKRKTIRDGDGECQIGGCRYTAINTRPSTTVEFRIFRGTLKVSSFKRNLELVDSLIAFVKCHSLYRLTVEAFVDFVGKQLDAGDTHKLALREWVTKFDAKKFQFQLTNNQEE